MTMPTDIYLKGALNAIRIKGDFKTTGLMMSAAAKNNLMFFEADDMQGEDCMFSISEVQWMRNVPEPNASA
jgi:hypothetical protein